MQDYAERATDLITQIDSGELDPEDVDITPFVENEDVVLTPGLAERLPDAKIEEYNARLADRQHHSLQSEEHDQANKHREALDVLEGVTETDPSLVTETVTLGQPPNTAEIVVTKKLTGDLQDTLTEIYDVRQSINVHNPADADPSNLRELKEHLINAILMLIVDDDEPNEDPYDWQSRDVWVEFYNRHGIEGLADAFEVLVGPAMRRGEDIKNSRNQNSVS